MINYTDHPNWDEEVAKLTNGEKVDFVIEIGGKATLGKSIKSTRSGGLVAISGYLGDYGKKKDDEPEEGKCIRRGGRTSSGLT
jgi:NADPH:quinone reductase-like Zn-dependent oxidoreductase